MASKTRPNHSPRDLYAEVTDRIVAALEQGVAPWVCPWRRDGEGGRPRNGASGHEYRGINILLTGMSGFASSRWYTFNQAKQLGASVRRGEKGTKITFWRFIKAKSASGDAKPDSNDDATGRTIPILKCFNVYNCEQIEWPDGSKHAVSDLADEGDHDADDNYEEAAALVAASGADIRHGGTRAYYSPSDDYIRVPVPSRFADTASYHATVMHELGHWTGHESRLARDLSGRFGSESYAAEELVAELAAAFLCADLGVAGKLQHAEYIGSWIQFLKTDKRTIFTAARMAQEAADYLSGGVGKDEVVEDAQNGAGPTQRAAG